MFDELQEAAETLGGIDRSSLARLTPDDAQQVARDLAAIVAALDPFITDLAREVDGLPKRHHLYADAGSAAERVERAATALNEAESLIDVLAGAMDRYRDAIAGVASAGPRDYVPGDDG